MICLANSLLFLLINLAETLVDEAVDLQYVGGTYGGSRKPAPFICLILKMLQIQPDLEIVFEFIKNNEYK